MATRRLPTLPQADVKAHTKSDACYVTIGTKVYDVTSFLDDHPGGKELILEHAGKDVADIMTDELSHTHSESAYEILNDLLIGFVATDEVMEKATDSQQPQEIVPLPPTRAGMEDLPSTMNGSATTANKARFAATGMSSAEDLSKETDTAADYRAHKFLDLDRPLLPQLWSGGFSKDFYLEQVHRPRHYKGGQSAPLFGNFLEPLSKTPWWVVPTIWLPTVLYGTLVSYRGLGVTPLVAAYWLTGLSIWTIVEYGMHRCLFHIDTYDLSPLPHLRVLMISIASCRTIVCSSHCIFCSTGYIITYPWIACVLSCLQRSLPSSPHHSGSLPTLCSSTTGLLQLRYTVGAYSGTFAMI